MIKKDKELLGAIIQGVELRTDGNVRDAIIRGEWCNYELTITTNRGILKFEGYHDYQGEIEIIN